MKRKPGFGWVVAVWGSDWQRAGYPGFRNKTGLDDAFIEYMKTGDFNNGVKIDFLPEVDRLYSRHCKMIGATPHPFPPSLQNQIGKLIAWRKKGRSVRDYAA